MSKPDESWRLFIAIELPEAIRHKVRQHIDRLRHELPEARASWTPEQNLHLTLKFFGDVRVPRIELISEALRRATTQVVPFEIEVGGCGAFPPRGKPNVLWIGIDDSSASLQRLHAALETECERAGFPCDQLSFHPHLTIARLRRQQDAL